jgi:zinc transport system substrate-binding protein
MHGLKICLLAIVCFCASNTWAQSTQVLVSIHPVALLIKSAWPQLQVDTLMKANQSPHDFALKPSHHGVITQAQHVVWLGKDMEPYLANVLRAKTNVLDLSALFDLHEQESSAPAHDDSESEHGANHEEDDHDAHNHGDQDPHIWLNPGAIKDILAMVQKQLDLPAPDAFLAKYAAWQVQAQKSLTKNPNGFISFHDAFHYWIKYFQLNQAAVLAIHPEQPIGTRHLLQVRELLEQGKVACLFVEPQFKASIVSKLQQGTHVPVVRIDPLASAFDVKKGQFLEFYQYLQQQFITCLTSK